MGRSLAAIFGHLSQSPENDDDDVMYDDVTHDDDNGDSETNNY